MTEYVGLSFATSRSVDPEMVLPENPYPVSQVHDAWMQQAINIISGTYGHTVSIVEKSKNLNKFGRTTNADSGVRTTVAEFGSVATINVNETMLTTNAIDYVASSSGSDTGILTVEGHTIDGSGNLTFAVQNVTLTGQTPAALTTPLARATRAFVKNGTFASPATDLVGDVYFYKSGGTVTAGVPQTSSDVHLRIKAGKNQTEKCQTAVSSVDYWIITEATFSISKDAGATVTADFELEVRELGGVWRPLGATYQVNSNQPSIVASFQPYRIVPPNSDVRVVVTSNTNDTEATAEIEGVLAIIT